MTESDHVQVFVWVKCPQCEGTARIGDADCWRCAGTGRRVQQQEPFGGRHG